MLCHDTAMLCHIGFLRRFSVNSLSSNVIQFVQNSNLITGVHSADFEECVRRLSTARAYRVLSRTPGVYTVRGVPTSKVGFEYQYVPGSMARSCRVYVGGAGGNFCPPCAQVEYSSQEQSSVLFHQEFWRSTSGQQFSNIEGHTAREQPLFAVYMY
eukprot:COSAG02_NODE_4270_length_5565_cov_3.849982_2_plen_156_part_00